MTDKKYDDKIADLYARSAANEIIAIRIYSYLATAFSKLEGGTKEHWLAKQKLEAIQSVDMWTVDHPEPEKIKARIREQIDNAFEGLVSGAPVGTPKQ